MFPNLTQEFQGHHSGTKLIVSFFGHGETKLVIPKFVARNHLER